MQQFHEDVFTFKKSTLELALEGFFTIEMLNSFRLSQLIVSIAISRNVLRSIKESIKIRSSLFNVGSYVDQMLPQS